MPAARFNAPPRYPASTGTAGVETDADGQEQVGVGDRLGHESFLQVERGSDRLARRGEDGQRSLVMDAAVWTAIGLLAATSLGALLYLGARIDGLGGRIDGLGARTDSLGARIDSLAARMDARFDGMESRFDALSTRLDTHLDRHAG